MTEENFQRWAVAKAALRVVTKTMKEVPNGDIRQIDRVNQYMRIANAQLLALQNSMKGIKTDESAPATTD